MQSMTEGEINELTDFELIELLSSPKNAFDKPTWQRFRAAIEARNLDQEATKKCPQCGHDQMGLASADYDGTGKALFHFHCPECGAWEEEEGPESAYLSIDYSERVKLGMLREQFDEGDED